VVMLCCLMETFSLWLQGWMDRLGWDQSEMARRAGVTRATINRVLSETRRPGPATCAAIAKALGVDDEEVLQRAGILNKRAGDMSLSEWIAAGRKLTSKERADLLQWAYAKLAQRDRDNT